MIDDTGFVADAYQTGSVSVTAIAQSPRGVTSVLLSVDGQLLCTLSTSPYTCTIDTRSLADGAHSMRAVATDGENSAQVDSTQLVDNVAAVVSLTAGVART